MLKFHDILKGRQCKHFSMKKYKSLNRLKFHMHVSDDDSICSASLMKLVNFEKMLKFHDISKGRHCRHFS